MAVRFGRRAQRLGLDVRAAWKSSKVEVDAEQKQREYLKTWLGKDMSGERYLTQLVTAATAQQQKQQAHAQEQQLQQQLQNEMRSKSSAAVSNQYFSVPVVSVKWASAPESIQADLAAALAVLAVNDACFLDFSGITAADGERALPAVVGALTGGAKAVQLLGAVNCLDEAAVGLARGVGLANVTLRPRGMAAASAPAAVAAAAPTPSSSAKQASAATAAAVTAAPSSSSSAAATIHYGAVRSGQQIYAEGCSLIIIGSVNDGAEVLADGDIHVYGALKGRAVAGLGGLAPTASVFANVFDASLVGIADAFVMPDDCPELRDVIGKAVRIRLAGKDGGDGKEIDCGNGNRLLVSVLPLKE